MNEIINKWESTGLLSSVTNDNKEKVSLILEDAMQKVLRKEVPYSVFEDKIVELRKQGFFSA